MRKVSNEPKRKLDKVGNLDPGDTFEVSGYEWIVTNYSTPGGVGCVCLETGKLENFADFVDVVPLNLEYREVPQDS